MQPELVADVTELINAQPLGRAQYRVIILCGLVVLLDGLTLQAIGLAAPVMTRALQIPPPAFGAVFSAALAGLALGSVGLGPVADRVGRKPVLVGATLCFGIFTLCTALAGSLHQLLLYRFLTGLGLGGAMPCFVSLTSEYVPRRMRGAFVSLVWTGFPIGGVVAGLLASWLISGFGWQSIFWVSGTAAVALAIALVFALPESIGYLVHHGAAVDRVARLIARAFPAAGVAAGTRFVLGEQASGATVQHLFTDGRCRGSVMLWVSYFIAFMMLVTNSSWSPTLLHAEGMEVARSAMAMATFNAGSVIGSSLAGYLVGRYGAAAVLPAVFVAGGVAMGMIGYAASSIALVILLEGLFGVFIGCGSSGLIALAAVFYPISIRSTGVGWAMAVGRFGSFVGPLAVGAAVGWHWGADSIFLAIGVPALLAAVTSALVIGRVDGTAITAVPR